MLIFGDSIFEDTETEFARRMQMFKSGLLRGEEVLAYYFSVDEDGAKELMPVEKPVLFGEQAQQEDDIIKLFHRRIGGITNLSRA